MRYFIDDSYDDIISIYSEVFLSSFPKESYNDKLKKGYRILNIKFVENDELVGFCLVLDKSNISTLHCWMGGVLPKYRKNGVFSGFVDWIVKYAYEKRYASVTVNTDNNKPDIIRILVKYGFIITNISDSEYGDGNKIMFSYEINSPRKMRLSITDCCNLDCFFCHSEGNFTSNSNNMHLSAIEQLLIQARRMNFSEITITGGEPLVYFEGVKLILSNCDKWVHPPRIKICTNGILIDDEKLQIIKKYSGKVELNISLHTVYEDIMSEISGVNLKISEFERIFKCLNNNNVDFRVNYVLLNGINNSQKDLIVFFDYLLSNNVSSAHLLELLITKEQKEFYKYYESIDEAEEKIKSLSYYFNIEMIKKTNKKVVFKLSRNDKYIKVVLFRLSCRCGCENCIKENDIKIGADMLLHPCYLEDVSCDNAVFNLKKAIEIRDEFMNTHDNEYSYETLYWGE